MAGIAIGKPEWPEVRSATALDAQRWRAQQEWISKAIACELRCEGGGDEILDGRNPNPPECGPRA